MRLLFFFVVYLVTLSTAYDLPGAYERLYYYYAYLIDCQLNGDVPKTMAPGCAKYLKIKEKRCNFNQFLEYITKPSTDSTLDFNIATKEPPPLEETANKLILSKNTGTYLTPRIHKDIQKNNDVEGVFRAVGNFVAGQISKLPNDDLKTPARDAIKAVWFNRMTASSNSLVEWITKSYPGLDFKYKETEFGTAGKVTLFDGVNTAKANPGQVTVDDLTAQRLAWRDPKHLANIKSAEEMFKLISATCSG
jgi:hypothetical protein